MEGLDPAVNEQSLIGLRRKDRSFVPQFVIVDHTIKSTKTVQNAALV